MVTTLIKAKNGHDVFDPDERPVTLPDNSHWSSENGLLQADPLVSYRQQQRNHSRYVDRKAIQTDRSLPFEALDPNRVVRHNGLWSALLVLCHRILEIQILDFFLFSEVLHTRIHSLYRSVSVIPRKVKFSKENIVKSSFKFGTITSLALAAIYCGTLYPMMYPYDIRRKNKARLVIDFVRAFGYFGDYSF